MGDKVLLQLRVRLSSTDEFLVIVSYLGLRITNAYRAYK